MKKNIFILVVVVLVLAGGISAYFYWQYIHSAPQTPIVQVPPPPPAPAPAKQENVQATETPKTEIKLPELAASDQFVLDALAKLLNNESLLNLFVTKRIIHNIVATIDNMPRKRMPASVIPVKRLKEPFLIDGPEDEKVIGLKNAERYANYVKIAEMIDAGQLVDLYVRLYPLFQEAYKELGYPKAYFNDRLLFVIDHLLATPDVKEPVRLVRPGVFYHYADQDLETRSAGQKLLLRVGSKNRTKIKAKLTEIKQEVILHMRDKKTGSAK